MKKYTQNIGIILILIGACTLILTRLSTLSTHNWLLITGLLFIVAGIILHIRGIKRESKY